jgi:hypothetical protein
MQSKTETLQEYLARGGTIKKVEAGKSDFQNITKRTTAGGEPAIILSLGDAEVYYGTPSKAKKKKAKVKSSLDMSLLPEGLRKKFISKIENGDYDGQEDGKK